MSVEQIVAILGAATWIALPLSFIISVHQMSPGSLDEQNSSHADAEPENH